MLKYFIIQFNRYKNYSQIPIKVTCFSWTDISTDNTFSSIFWDGAYFPE